VRSTILFQYPWTLFKNLMHYPLFGKIPVWMLVVSFCQVWLWRLFFQYGDFRAEPNAVERAFSAGGWGILLAFLFMTNLLLSVLEVGVVIIGIFILTDELLGSIHLPRPDLAPIKDAWDDFYHKVCKPVTWE
jgi:hypothetical protein